MLEKGYIQLNTQVNITIYMLILNYFVDHRFISFMKRKYILKLKPFSNVFVNNNFVTKFGNTIIQCLNRNYILYLSKYYFWVITKPN